MGNEQSNNVMENIPKKLPLKNKKRNKTFKNEQETNITENEEETNITENEEETVEEINITEELKTEELKTEELKTEELKTEELKTEELKTEDIQDKYLVLSYEEEVAYALEYFPVNGTRVKYLNIDGKLFIKPKNSKTIFRSIEYNIYEYKDSLLLLINSSSYIFLDRLNPNLQELKKDENEELMLKINKLQHKIEPTFCVIKSLKLIQNNEHAEEFVPSIIRNIYDNLCEDKNYYNKSEFLNIIIPILIETNSTISNSVLKTLLHKNNVYISAGDLVDLAFENDNHIAVRCIQQHNSRCDNPCDFTDYIKNAKSPEMKKIFEEAEERGYF